MNTFQTTNGILPSLKNFRVHCYSLVQEHARKAKSTPTLALVSYAKPVPTLSFLKYSLKKKDAHLVLLTLTAQAMPNYIHLQGTLDSTKTLKSLSLASMLKLVCKATQSTL